MKTIYQLFILAGLMIWTLSLPASQTSGTSSASVQQAKLTVTTVKVTDIKDTQAKCSFSIQGSPISEKGVCFSENQGPTINSKKSMAPSNQGNTGNSIMMGLKPATTYYIRAYAKSGAEIYYGNELTFTTLQKGGESKTTNAGQKIEPKSGTSNK